MKFQYFQCTTAISLAKHRLEVKHLVGRGQCECEDAGEKAWDGEASSEGWVQDVEVEGLSYLIRKRACRCGRNSMGFQRSKTESRNIVATCSDPT